MRVTDEIWARFVNEYRFAPGQSLHVMRAALEAALADVPEPGVRVHSDGADGDPTVRRLRDDLRAAEAKLETVREWRNEWHLSDAPRRELDAILDGEAREGPTP